MMGIGKQQPVLLLLATIASLLITFPATTHASPRDCGSLATRWNETNLSEVFSLWSKELPTKEQQSKLVDLGQRLKDVDHWKNDPFEVVRILDQYGLDVDLAEAKFRGMVQWRLDHEMDSFVERYGEPPEVFRYSPFFVMAGLDKEGDPVFVQRHGSWDAWGLINEHPQGGPKAMLDANLFVSELISDRCFPIQEYNWQQAYYEPLAKRRFKYFTNVIDLQNLSARQVRPALLSFLKDSAQVGQDYYPGFSKRVVLIRAPKLFRWAWKLASHFYEDRVLAKFVFVTDKDPLPKLAEYMDLELLPSSINPDSRSAKTMPGYWSTIVQDGGRITKDMALS